MSVRQNDRDGRLSERPSQEERERETEREVQSQPSH